MKSIPDEIIEYVLGFCTNCSTILEEELSTLEEHKQEIVIPPFQATYIEHQSFSKICKCCGIKVITKLPDHITAPIQYGKSDSYCIGEKQNICLL